MRDKCGEQGWHNCAGVLADSDMQDAKAIYFAVCRAVELKPVGDLATQWSRGPRLRGAGKHEGLLDD